MNEEITSELRRLRRSFASTIFSPQQSLLDVTSPIRKGHRYCDAHLMMDPSPAFMHDGIPPPPPLPIMKKKNSVEFDLTPIDMLPSDGKKSQKPHVDTIVSPIYRELDVVKPTQDQLLYQKSRLRKTDRSDSLLSYKSATERPLAPGIRSPVTHTDLSEHNEMQHKVPHWRQSPSNRADNNQTRAQKEHDEGLALIRSLQQQMERVEAENKKMKSQLDSSVQNGFDQRPTMSHSARNPFSRHFNPSDFYRQEKSLERKIRDDQSELESDRVNRWLRTVPTDKQSELTPPSSPEQFKTVPARQKSRSRQTQHSNMLTDPRSHTKRTDYDAMSTTSRRSKKSKAASLFSTGSGRSVTKSIKSVLLNISDAKEIMSERDSDDLVDIEDTSGDVIGRTCNRLTIHGPFVDDELNVYHEICTEYKKAAEITFAKRSVFSREKPAFERVYYLLASNKRTKHLNRRDWTAASCELKLLDYLFRDIIRSESQRIREPKLAISHFSRGKQLNPDRFRAIIKSAFARRDQLINTVANGIPKFEQVV